MVCLLIAGGFALGAMLGASRVFLPDAATNPFPPAMRGPPRRLGTYAAIDHVEGNRIRLRDPRSGRTWSVRANSNTVVELGAQRRIPFQELRPGQRVFVIGDPEPGAPSGPAQDPEWNAQFIGVVLGQPQKYVVPPPVWCDNCTE
jgi:hypothetical protein